MRNGLICILLALALSLAHADTTTRTFTNYYGSAPLAYITTDLEANPSLSAPDYACVGSSVTPTLQVSTDWYSSVYDAKLKSNANLQSCLTPSSTVNQNQPISWLSASSYACAFGAGTQVFFGSYGAFTSFMSGCGVSSPPDIIEKSQYYDTNGVPYSGLYKAGIGTYCNGNVSVISSGPYSYNSQYLGTNPSLPALTSSTPADITLQAKLDTSSCGATSHAYVSSACQGDSVYKHVNTTAPNFVAWSAVKTVHFRNPFICNLAALSFAPMAMNNSTTYNFNLVLKNNGDSVNITSITLAAGSQFTNFALGAPTLPYTFAAGAQTTFSGTVKSPAATGMLPLALNINSVSTAPNCTGSTANCNLQATFMINVTSSSQPPPPNPPTSCTLAFSGGHSANFTAPDSATVVATCRNSTNAVLPCGYLAWTTTANGGSVSPASTTTPPQQSQSTFSINAVSAPQSAQVKAQQGSNFSCTIALNIIAPDYIPLLSAPSQVQVNQQFTADITTKNIGAAANISTYTKLQFRSLTQTFSVAPLGQQATQANSYNFTCPATPGLYELNATVDATNLLTEGSESNNFATQMVNCTAAPPVLKPNYVPNISVPSSFFVGQAFTANFTTKNTGQAAATVPSTTRATFQSTVKDFSVAPLAVNAQQADSWNFSCTSTGAKSMVETVDYTGVINESSETDNNQTKPITCYAAPTSCTLAFVGHSSILLPTDSALVQATCFAGSAQTACPPFLWQQNAAGGSMSPTNTPMGLLPSSTLSTFTAPVPQVGRIVNATSTLPSYPLYCELPFAVSQNGSAPDVDYNLSSLHADAPSALLGQTVHFTTVVKNIGSLNAVNDSTTVATYSPGCTPVTSSYFLPALNAGQSDTDTTLACTCAAIGQQSILADANPSHAQSEATYSNNQKSLTFICRSAAQQTCSDFI